MIPLLAEEDARTRAKELGLPDDLARVNAFRVLLQNPGVAGVIGKQLVKLLFEGSLDARLRELVILRTGWRTGSEYEFCQHVAVSRRLKIPEHDILGVRDPDACPTYSRLDRAVIRMTDELLDRTEVSPPTWAILEQAFSPAILVELLAVAGNWRFFAMFLKSAKVPLDAGVPSWPEGKAPPAAGR